MTLIQQASAQKNEPLGEPSEDDIRLRSYLIWEREGKPDNRSAEHWTRARQELIALQQTMLSLQASPPPNAARANASKVKKTAPKKKSKTKGRKKAKSSRASAGRTVAKSGSETRA